MRDEWERRIGSLEGRMLAIEREICNRAKGRVEETRRRAERKRERKVDSSEGGYSGRVSSH